MQEQAGLSCELSVFRATVACQGPCPSRVNWVNMDSNWLRAVPIIALMSLGALAVVLRWVSLLFVALWTAREVIAFVWRAVIACLRRGFRLFSARPKPVPAQWLGFLV